MAYNLTPEQEYKLKQEISIATNKIKPLPIDMSGTTSSLGGHSGVPNNQDLGGAPKRMLGALDVGTGAGGTGNSIQRSTGGVGASEGSSANTAGAGVLGQMRNAPNPEGPDYGSFNNPYRLNDTQNNKYADYNSTLQGFGKRAEPNVFNKPVNVLGQGLSTQEVVANYNKAITDLQTSRTIGAPQSSSGYQVPTQEAPGPRERALAAHEFRTFVRNSGLSPGRAAQAFSQMKQRQLEERKLGLTTASDQARFGLEQQKYNTDTAFKQTQLGLESQRLNQANQAAQIKDALDLSKFQTTKGLEERKLGLSQQRLGFDIQNAQAKLAQDAQKLATTSALDSQGKLSTALDNLRQLSVGVGTGEVPRELYTTAVQQYAEAGLLPPDLAVTLLTPEEINAIAQRSQLGQ